MKMENFEIVHYFWPIRSWKVARMVIRWKQSHLYQRKPPKALFWGLDHDETHWFLTSNQWFFRTFQEFSVRRGEMGVGGTSKVGVWPKDTGFERFRSILDDPENLSKKYYVSSEKSRKKLDLILYRGTLILRLQEPSKFQWAAENS